MSSVAALLGLEEAAVAEGNGEAEDKGLRCPTCHCRDLRVYRTVRLRGDRIRRVRICRHCGRRMVTTERRTGET